MKVTRTLVLSLLLILGLAGLAVGRDLGTRNGLTPAASYGESPSMHKGRHRHGRHHRRWHRRGRGRRHGRRGMRM